LLRDCALLVNGDDCLFKVTQEGYKAWSTFGTMAGLTPSVGKVYFSKHFCNINSTTFLYTPVLGRTPFTRVDVIRLGLVFGLKRSLAQIEQEQPLLNLLGNGVEWDSSLGSRHRALMFECPESCKVRVHRKFLQKNRELLEAATEYRMPWYIPECYGGVGLVSIGEYGPTLLDRQVVTAMLHPSAWCADPSRLHLPIQWKGPSKTRIHQVAIEKLRSVLGDVPTRWVEQGSSDLDGLDSPSLDWWILYQLPERVLTSDSDARTAHLALSQNRKVWNWYVKHASKFAWMQPSPLRMRRLVHDIVIHERRPAILPTMTEMAFRDVDVSLYREDVWSEPLIVWSPVVRLIA